ncbi:MAG: SWIM zinc finger family protein [Syntrophomonas sp.]|uniref:SWIM zinc finger family protein n=1 Tax=Syntrophomonas sp. TaxID=2053627 RepID=UPI0026085E2B|nr:SWIM zinc finger family protein [Syntrophomonas sp.]MDD2510270.1 SWIM zinc finger family protein [Syntrophomonas sp.]MDD3879281.1 SWIM zinc finger family protein [Syntrophomonas sp.]MDD4627029.1 SWIM zinc finger family protein [Syntrophomonas sp.]
MGRYDRGYEYVPVAYKKEMAKMQLEKLKKKNPDLAPVVIAGSKLATTWWGKAWNKNLESYADYSNRIGRGRSYVRNGAVLDLQIEIGLVTALVQGSVKKPYQIKIEIAPLANEKWEYILKVCNHKIDNLAELIEGTFPKELEELFTLKGAGLFPSAKEIQFSCSCPDWAGMCKHVAAVLYGIGARFDQDPTLFFKLRDIDFEVLLKKTIEQKMQSLLANSGRTSPRVIDDQDVFELFGV